MIKNSWELSLEIATKWAQHISKAKPWEYEEGILFVLKGQFNSIQGNTLGM